MLFLKYSWLFLIVVQCLNGIVWWFNAQKKIKIDPSLLVGYKKLIFSWIVYGNIPWLIMGVGIVSGYVSNVLSYFNPNNGVFVWIFYVSIVVLLIMNAYWIIFKKGAETLIKYPGLFRGSISSPFLLKVYVAVSLFVGLAMLVLMLLGYISLPSDSIMQST